MKLRKNKFLMTVAAVALTFAVGACSSSSDDDNTLAATTPTTPTTPTAPAPPTLESVQTDAATAATEAQTAATAAQTAADAAETARANRAAIQTGDFHAGNSGELADKAQEHATAAQDAADDASDASDAAADATELSSATRALVIAETEQATAEKQQMYAETAQGNAMTAAAGEIGIVEKTKTVDGTSITIDEKEHSETINDVTKITGLLTDENITTMGVEEFGEDMVPANDQVTPPVAIVAAIPGAAARDLDIGFTYDSADDSARVTLVHSYAGTKTVTAFMRSGTSLTGAKAGMVDGIDHDGDDTADSPVVSLPLKTAAGSFYRSDNLDFGGRIGAMEEATPLLYYEMADGTKVYVESAGTPEVEGEMGVFQHNYEVVNIRAGAKIPEATEYSHLHFGIWAGLEEANEVTGANDLADLGIGFVANIGEMTSNMPNFGGAMYKGNWVANVQAAEEDGDGDFSRHDGEASMIANFTKATVDVTLTGLATLDGTIDGNTFSGTKAALAADDVVDDAEARDMLGADAEFEGNFSGAFFGNLAAEAGGVFDFASDDGNNEGGAFRGAFGADQKPPAQ